MIQYQGQAVRCFTTFKIKYSDSIFILVHLKVHVLDNNVVSEYIFIFREETRNISLTERQAFDPIRWRDSAACNVRSNRKVWTLAMLSDILAHAFIILCPHIFTNHPLPSVKGNRDTQVNSSSNAPRCSMPCSASSKVRSCREAIASYPHYRLCSHPKS